MCRHAGPLDALIAHEIARRTRAGCGCGCARCRGRLAFEAAPARRATRSSAGGRALPAWDGWSPPVSLREILAARDAGRAGQPVAPELRPFLASGRPQVYRISRAGIDRDRPLSIGMVERRRSVAERIWDHFRRPSRADPAVHAALRNLQPGQILVQVGRLGGAMNVRRAHGYEIWLQDRERPLVFDPNSRTFDEAAGLWS
jgi:hypothetical protein